MKIIILISIFLNLCLVFNGQNISVMPTQAYINLGESVELHASGASYYYWTPDYGLSNCFGPTTIASPATTTTYTVTGCELSSEELVVNGDFEQGNFAFTSSYQYTTNLVPEGTYYVGENANNYHYGFIGIGHGGTGNFMIVNGATNPGTNVWTEQISVSPNTYYAFSTWICNVSVGNPDVVAMLQFSINGIQLGEIFSGINELNVWEQFYVLWYSGNSNIANISILNQNTIAGGNDFGLDDISFRRLESVGEAQSTINLQMPDIHLPDNIDSVLCAFTPDAHIWSIIEGGSSPALSHVYAQPFVGDIDNDGHSEIVTVGFSDSFTNSSSIVIYNDQLQYITSISTPNMYVYGGYPIAIADVDRDGYAEIFIHDANGFLHNFHFNETSFMKIWTSETPTITGYSSNLIVADINEDGIPEICAMNKIYNAITGSELITLPEVVGCSDIFFNWGHAAMPVYADFDNDGILEIAGGNKVYKLNITNPNNSTGNSATLWKSVTGTGIGDGLSSVADIDLDGFLDLVVVRLGNMYVWKPYLGSTSIPSVLSICPYNSEAAGSRALIADVNNDGYPEVLFTYVSRIVSYRYDDATQQLLKMWEKTTSDISGATTMTAFDFNQDETIEIVYRDQSNLRIIDGITGENKTVFACVSPTAVEYPAIVDLNRDGQAEILVSSNNYDNDHDMHGKLKIFKNPTHTIWAPSRYVWNQHAYNVVGINNDLTIPVYNFNPATVFIDPEGIVRRPFNNFLQQATTLDQYGRPYTAAADASLNALEIENNDESILLKATYSNDGNNILLAPYSITAFANEYGGNILKTKTVTIPLQIDETTTQYISLDKNDICGNNDLSSIVVAINCSGIGIAQNGGHQPECDTINNIFSIEITALSDTTYLYESACEPFVWYGNELTQTGDYEHTLTNIYGCDSLLLLHLEMGSLDTLHVSANACEYYEWYGNTYLNSGIYNHIVHNEEGCDSIINLNLTINNSPNLEIHGLTQVAISSDLWPGIYNYCIADSIELQQCNVTWSCSNPEWIVLPSDNPYWFRLIANTLGKATLTAMADCESGCNAIASIEIQASFIGVDEIDDNQVSIYPNPASDRLIIKGEQMKQIIIYNCYGQRFNDTKMDLNDEVTIDTENMSNGLYIADIITTKGKITKRILIAK